MYQMPAVCNMWAAYHRDHKIPAVKEASSLREIYTQRIYKERQGGNTMEQTAWCAGEEREWTLYPAGIQKKIHGEGGIWTVLKANRILMGSGKAESEEMPRVSKPSHLWGHGLEAIQKLGQHTPLLFFYSKDCAFCLTFWPKFDHALDDWQCFSQQGQSWELKYYLPYQ